MNQEDLAHAIRAACQLLDEPHVVVFGSQSLLASHAESELPPETTLSAEVDITPGQALQLDLPEPELSTKLWKIEAVLGEDSQFHERFGFYVEAIRRDSVALPLGWEGRLVCFSSASRKGGTGYLPPPGRSLRREGNRRQGKR